MVPLYSIYVIWFKSILYARLNKYYKEKKNIKKNDFLIFEKE